MPTASLKPPATASPRLQLEDTGSAGQAPPKAYLAYGTHPRQVLDFYHAVSSQATPLVFHIHGGGWVAGDKASVGGLDKYLAAGISVVSINYRYVTQGHRSRREAAGPRMATARCCPRALQFVRSKAGEWNLDKTRIGATGGSAGACSSLWLAFHDDMADPKSSDPIAAGDRRGSLRAQRRSSGAQTTLDPQQMKEWTPNSRYGGHAFGFMPDPNNLKTRDTQFPQFLEARRAALALDQGILSLRARYFRRSADLHDLFVAAGLRAERKGSGRTRPTSA